MLVLSPTTCDQRRPFQMMVYDAIVLEHPSQSHRKCPWLLSLYPSGPWSLEGLVRASSVEMPFKFPLYFSSSNTGFRSLCTGFSRDFLADNIRCPCSLGPFPFAKILVYRGLLAWSSIVPAATVCTYTPADCCELWGVVVNKRPLQRRWNTRQAATLQPAGTVSSTLSDIVYR